jgi:chemotaxis protein MotB
MPARQTKRKEKRRLDPWVMTYGDMMSLLLTFFVLIVSFSSIQESKFQQAALSLRGAFGVMSKPPSVLEMKKPIVPQMATRERENILYELRRLEESLLDTGIDRNVDIKVTEKGIAFRIRAPLLFGSGRADMRTDAPPVLERLAEYFRAFPYPLRIEGHTDSVPIHNDRFPSNWELSAARAVTVARFLQQAGVAPEDLAAIGYGEYHPLASNDTADGRERNRRVEIFMKLDRSPRDSGPLPLEMAPDGASAKPGEIEENEDG